MKIAIFHELEKLSGARKIVNGYGKILKKENVVDLYYVDYDQEKNLKNNFTNSYFYKFKEKKWEGNNWKIKLYKDTIELIKLYLLHRKVAKIINSKEYDFVLVNPSKFTQTPFLLRFIDKSIYFCQEPLRLVYDDLFRIPDLNLFKQYYEEINRKIRKLIDRSNINNASLVLANSFFSKQNIKKAYDIKAVVCYLGVDENIFFPTGIQKKFDLLFIGDKSSIEGYDLLTKTLKMYRKVPKICYILRDKTNKRLSEIELIKKYNQVKIVLCLSRSEPFGLISLEAMSCGIPVIAVNEGGYKESVVDGKTGYLVEFSSKILKEKIDYLIDNNQIREKMGMLAREHVLKKFTLEKSVINFLKIVNENI